jgi:hypothetical protein
MLGSGVLFDARADTIEATHASAFALQSAVTVAAWIRPQAATVGSVINKQSQNDLAFELLHDRNKVTFSVRLQRGNKTQLVSSSITVPAQTWTHVAGVYDGQFVRLFRNGVQVGQVAATGPIADVTGPVRIGNNRNNQFFPGRLDEAQLFNRALADFELAELPCLRRAPTLAVSPTNPAAVEPEVSVHYDIAFTNNNGGACQPSDAALSISSNEPGISISANQTFFSVASGETAHFPVDVTGSSDAEPGTHLIPFQLFDFSAGFEPHLESCPSP